MFKSELDDHISVFKNLESLESSIDELIGCAVNVLSGKRKIIFAGNGGSAADAQHIATEFTVKFSTKRAALPAISLATDTSALTAIGNDFGFDYVFSRQLEAIGTEGDLLILISTSGQSRNLIECACVAQSMGLTTFGLLGCDGGKLKGECDKSIIVSDFTTARIQEAHIFILHYLISSVERILYHAR